MKNLLGILSLITFVVGVGMIYYSIWNPTVYNWQVSATVFMSGWLGFYVFKLLSYSDDK